MRFKRRVLSALRKAVLFEIGRGLELDVTTRMRVRALRDVLAKRKRAMLDAIVWQSRSRGTLEDTCVAAELDPAPPYVVLTSQRDLQLARDREAPRRALHIDERMFPMANIPAHLQPLADVGGARDLDVNEAGTSMRTFGNAAFVLPSSDAAHLRSIAPPPVGS